MTKQEKKSILVVEDEKPLSEALRFKFENEGFTVHCAHDGEVGLELALTHHPDMILLDIVMPKVDGLTMLERLREHAWGKTANVIMLTNLSDYGHATKAAEHRVHDVLVKSDWKIVDLVKKVKKKLKMD